MEKDVCIKYLERAVEVTKSEKLRVKLCSAVDNRDTTAIDVTYHKDCWTNNVFHILRKEEILNLKRSEKVAEISAKIVFSNTISHLPRSGLIHVKNS